MVKYERCSEKEVSLITLKNYCHIWNQQLRIYLIAKFCEETKMAKFGIKNALWVLGIWYGYGYLVNGYFWAGILQNYCHIWNQQLQICLIAKFCEETKITTFGIKNAIFGYFWPRFLKHYRLVRNQHLRISVTAKFCEETKMPKSGTKNQAFLVPDLRIFIFAPNFARRQIQGRWCQIWQ